MSYLACSAEWHKASDTFYVVADGVKQGLPRYYRDKIFYPALLWSIETRRPVSFGYAVVKEKRKREALEIQQRLFRKELQRLALEHPRPSLYMAERDIFNEQRVRRLANKNDLL